jgi:hypothetical protein
VSPIYAKRTVRLIDCEWTARRLEDQLESHSSGLQMGCYRHGGVNVSIMFPWLCLPKLPEDVLRRLLLDPSVGQTLCVLVLYIYD